MSCWNLWQSAVCALTEIKIQSGGLFWKLWALNAYYVSNKIKWFNSFDYAKLLMCWYHNIYLLISIFSKSNLVQQFLWIIVQFDKKSIYYRPYTYESLILAQLSQKLLIKMSVVRCGDVNFWHFHLLLQKHWNNFNQIWHKASLGEGYLSFFKWGAPSFSKGDNCEKVKIH